MNTSSRVQTRDDAVVSRGIYDIKMSYLLFLLLFPCPALSCSRVVMVAGDLLSGWVSGGRVDALTRCVFRVGVGVRLCGENRQ